ncbi:hypothetical protein J2T57_001287 [Natronocella acetinitrilica]|uniref:Uncharacterized protein n=1 Tax=Natronocella acetinitrilica TaxID=414046 RepID=A0AAE3G1P0_9GAMM|nr:hypothetical protein [Natronocella acetinitrilica]MCP1674185.1 hypothetical protein [Natronocella acetinitrilica]
MSDKGARVHPFAAHRQRVISESTERSGALLRQIQARRARARAANRDEEPGGPEGPAGL